MPREIVSIKTRRFIGKAIISPIDRPTESEWGVVSSYLRQQMKKKKEASKVQVEKVPTEPVSQG